MPDLLVVDEAHAARVKRELDGSRRPTLLWRMLSDIGERIPHLVFLTATPMQMDPSEYHALLGLLGLPASWQDEGAYLASLRILATGDRPPGAPR